MNIAVVGLGAFGQKHLDALALIDDATITNALHVLGVPTDQATALIAGWAAARLKAKPTAEKLPV